MSVDINKHPAWFRSADRCRYSDLAVAHPKTFVSRHPESNYFVDMAKLGERILLVKASGYVRSYEMAECLQFMEDFIATVFDQNSDIIYIEDYADVEGADPEARKKYINRYVTLKREKVFSTAILYNQPILYKISYRIARRLYSLEDVYDIPSYTKALDLALGMIKSRDAGQRLNLSRDEKILTPVEKSSEKVRRFFRFLWGAVKSFKTKVFLSLTKKTCQQYSDALLGYIASINWHEDGIKKSDIIVMTDPSVKKVAEAISYIKSEIDDLLRERDAVEKDLRDREARYRLLVEHAKAGILEFDYRTNRIISVNDSVTDITGYTKEEILAMSPLDILTEESRKIFARRHSQRISGKILSPGSAYQIIAKNGRGKWVLLNTNITYKTDGLPQKADVVLTDITHLKEIESQLVSYQSKLKQLSIQLSKSEENQRRHLASRLHESVSQELFAAQLKLKTIEKFSDDAAYVRQLEDIRDQIVKSIREIKTITHDLSPPVLYDLGLKEAVEALAKSIEKKYPLAVKVLFKRDPEDVGDEIKVIMYRVTKELIHNAIRHAEANTVNIMVDHSNDVLEVSVADDGIGFDADRQAGGGYSDEGFGLFDIREKIHHLGGQVAIESAPGAGTRIRIRVPINESEITSFKN